MEERETGGRGEKAPPLTRGGENGPKVCDFIEKGEADMTSYTGGAPSLWARRGKKKAGSHWKKKELPVNGNDDEGV